ncbi:MAG: lipopolysaccharide biosynthesis protein [Planctomycetota bacterium]|jgi:PST family polysaccharide transporter
MACDSDGGKIFQTEHLKANLTQRSARGGIITIIAQVTKFGCQLTFISVLGRVLEPADFGLVAMVTAITGFLNIFKDMGLSMATVQKAEIDKREVSTLFWFNMSISILITTVLMAASPLIAWFYNEPRLVKITIVLAMAFIFGGLTIQHQALLRRQMRFFALAIVEVAAIALGVTLSIVSALLGAGYWALVIMPLTGAAVIAAGVWVACPWVPGLPVRGSGVRRLVMFGGNITAFNVINYFSRALDRVLIGRYWGVESLGYYERAYKILLLPLRQINLPISTVAIPALSRLQNEPEKYRRYYLKIISLIAMVTMPVVMFMVIMSGPLVKLVLGAQWVATSRIFAILGISALIQPIHNTTGWLYISMGRPDRMFRYGVIYSIVIVTSFFIGLPFGAIGVATSYTVSIFLVFIPWLHYACKATPVDVLGVAKTLWPIGVATLVAGAALGFFKAFLPGLSTGVLGLPVGFVITMMVFLSVLCAFARGLNPIRDVLNLLRLAWSQKTDTTEDDE